MYLAASQGFKVTMPGSLRRVDEMDHPSRLLVLWTLVWVVDITGIPTPLELLLQLKAKLLVEVLLSIIEQVIRKSDTLETNFFLLLMIKKDVINPYLRIHRKYTPMLLYCGMEIGLGRLVVG
jgi:hypothetical protein